MSVTGTKSILAKLLANENLEIIHENSTTAKFDTVNRRLYLPNWVDMEQDLYDLFIGHEIGHALETPPIDTTTFDVPFGYINVVEDIRIENKVLARYPGLVFWFKKGYDLLLERDFFQIKGKEVVDLDFMNRLNLKSKLRDKLEVPFLDDELPLFNKAMNVQTWEDTLEVAKELWEFMKEKKEEQEQEETSSSDDGDDEQEQQQEQEETDSKAAGEEEEEDAEDAGEEEAGESDDEDELEESEATTDEQQESGDSGEKEQTEPESDGGDDEQEEHGGQSEEVEEEIKQPSSMGRNTDGGADNLEDVSTQTALEENKQALTDKSGFNPIEGLQPWQIDECITKPADFFQNELMEGDRALYQELFVLKNKKQVNHLVNEFNRKKAAFEYSKAKTSKTGDIDVNKLHEHRFNDDIFNTVTALAKGKSHGMLFLIDMSGSMGTDIKTVVIQTLLLTEFCRRVQIPFDVYTFTQRASFNYEKTEPYAGLIDHREIMIGHCLSSSMKKRDLDRYSALLFCAVAKPYGSDRTIHGRMGGTPFDTVLTGMPHIIDRFIEKHRTQKLVLNILTDGASHPLTPVQGTRNRLKIKIKKNTIVYDTSARWRSDFYAITTERLINNLKNLYPSMRLVGYFIDSSRRHDEVQKCQDYKVPFKMMRKAFREEGMAAFGKLRGYDKYFILEGSRQSMMMNNSNSGELVIDKGASRNKIASTFMKNQKTSKKGRLFVNEFIKEIS